MSSPSEIPYSYQTSVEWKTETCLSSNTKATRISNLAKTFFEKTRFQSASVPPWFVEPLEDLRMEWCFAVSPAILPSSLSSSAHALFNMFPVEAENRTVCHYVAILQNDKLEIRLAPSVAYLVNQEIECHNEYPLISEYFIPTMLLNLPENAANIDPFLKWRKLSWSHDAKLVAFSSSHGHIFVVDVNGCLVQALYPFVNTSSLLSATSADKAVRSSHSSIAADPFAALLFLPPDAGKLSSSSDELYGSLLSIRYDGLVNSYDITANPFLCDCSYKFCPVVAEKFSFGLSAVFDAAFDAESNIIIIAGSSPGQEALRSPDFSSAFAGIVTAGRSKAKIHHASKFRAPSICFCRIERSKPIFLCRFSVDTTPSFPGVLNSKSWNNWFSWKSFVFKGGKMPPKPLTVDAVIRVSISPNSAMAACLLLSGSFLIISVPSGEVMQRGNLGGFANTTKNSIVSVSWWSDSQIIITKKFGSVMILALADLDREHINKTPIVLEPDMTHASSEMAPNLFVSENREINRLVFLSHYGRRIKLRVTGGGKVTFATVQEKLRKHGVEAIGDAASDEHLYYNFDDTGNGHSISIRNTTEFSMFRVSTVIYPGIQRLFASIVSYFLWHSDVSAETSPDLSPKYLTITKTVYRLGSFFRITPLELILRKIHFGVQDSNLQDILSTAQKYGLDSDIVYKAKWESCFVGHENVINSCFDFINDKLWVLEQCTLIKPEWELPFVGKIIDYGLTLAAELTSKSEDSLEKLKTYERCLRVCSERLVTFRELDVNGFSLTFASFLYDDLVETACLLAKRENVFSLCILFRRHFTQLWPHRYVILSSFPETLDPVEYESLLPKVRECTGDFLKLEIPYYETSVECDFNESKALADWYSTRALTIFSITGMLSIARKFASVAFARCKVLPGAVWCSSLCLTMRDLNNLYDLTYRCGIEVPLPLLREMSHAEIFHSMMSGLHSFPSHRAPLLYEELLLPLVSRYTNSSDSFDLKSQAIVVVAKNHFDFAFQFFQCMKSSVDIPHQSAYVQLGIDIVYNSDSTQIWLKYSDLISLLEAIQKDIKSVTLERLMMCRSHITIGKIFCDRQIFLNPKSIADILEKCDTVRLYFFKLCRSLIGEDVTTLKYMQLLKDVQTCLSHVSKIYATQKKPNEIINDEICRKEILQALLESKKFSIVEHMIHEFPVLIIQEVGLKCAIEFFETANADQARENFESAFHCLEFLPKSLTAKNLRRFIGGVAALYELTPPEKRVPPHKIRNMQNKLNLLKDLILKADIEFVMRNEEKLKNICVQLSACEEEMVETSQAINRVTIWIAQRAMELGRFDLTARQVTSFPSSIQATVSPELLSLYFGVAEMPSLPADVRRFSLGLAAKNQVLDLNDVITRWDSLENACDVAVTYTLSLSRLVPRCFKKANAAFELLKVFPDIQKVNYDQFRSTRAGLEKLQDAVVWALKKLIRTNDIPSSKLITSLPIIQRLEGTDNFLFRQHLVQIGNIWPQCIHSVLNLDSDDPFELMCILINCSSTMLQYQALLVMLIHFSDQSECDLKDLWATIAGKMRSLSLHDVLRVELLRHAVCPSAASVSKITFETPDQDLQTVQKIISHDFREEVLSRVTNLAKNIREDTLLLIAGQGKLDRLPGEDILDEAFSIIKKCYDNGGKLPVMVGIYCMLRDSGPGNDKKAELLKNFVFSHFQLLATFDVIALDTELISWRRKMHKDAKFAESVISALFRDGQSAELYQLLSWRSIETCRELQKR